MQESEESGLLARIEGGGPEAWQAFLESCSETIFRVIRLFADSYDDRMDLFLFVCSRLKADDMRRVRSFRRRPEAPCRFTTWLSVVVKNIAVDFIRSRDGRFRPFRAVEAMEEPDRLLFEYHLRDGRSLEEARDLIVSRHGIRLSAGEASERPGRVRSRLSANQRWRLLARLAERRSPVTIDTVVGVAHAPDLPIPPADERADPEGELRARDAERVLNEAMRAIAPRQRLALTLHYRDGMPAREAAAVLAVSPAEAERLAAEGIASLRERLRRSGIARPDLESSGLASLWPS